MRVLFVSEYIDEKGQGAYELARAHYNSLCSILGEQNVDLLSLKLSRATECELPGSFYSGFKSKFGVLRNLIEGYPTFFNKSLSKLIVEKIQNNKYDLVFFDNSYFGRIIREIKRNWPSLPVVVFYVGVKANSGRQIKKKYYYKPNVLLMVKNNNEGERLTVDFADIHILL